jgi:hypothetical protein
MSGVKRKRAASPKRKPKAPGVGGGSQAQAVKAVPDSIAEGLADPHRKRGTYALLQRAIDVAMDIPFDAMRLASLTAVRDLNSNDDRIRSRAREFLLKVQDSGIGAAVDFDRINRLDEGTATENIAVAAITPEALAAVAKTLRDHASRD